MKNESSRTGSQSKPIAGRHQFEHEQPTVIHDREENMMVLARWTHRAMKNPTRFWGTILAVAAGLLALVVAANLVITGSSGDSEVWSKLETAKTPSDRLKVAEDFPATPAAVWARLRAATEFYNQGFADLPNHRDVALPTLKKALDIFNDVAKDAPQDSIQARIAAMGKARTLEARNELTKAIDQYHFIEKTWPGSAEADQARQLAAALEKPEAASFYKELYAYSPSSVTLPLEPAPGSGMGPGSSTKDIMPGGSFSMPLLPPPPPSPVSKNRLTPAASAETKKPAPVLPEDPFDPGTKPSAPKPPAASTPASSPGSTTSAAPKSQSKPPAQGSSSTPKR